MPAAMLMREVAKSLAANSTGGAFEWRGGKGTLVVAGTVASGVVVKLQMSPDAGTTWVDVAAAFDEDESPEPLSVAQPAAMTFECCRCLMRIATTAGGTTSVTAWVGEIYDRTARA